MNGASPIGGHLRSRANTTPCLTYRCARLRQHCRLRQSRKRAGFGRAAGGWWRRGDVTPFTANCGSPYWRGWYVSGRGGHSGIYLSKAGGSSWFDWFGSYPACLVNACSQKNIMLTWTCARAQDVRLIDNSATRAALRARTLERRAAGTSQIKFMNCTAALFSRRHLQRRASSLARRCRGSNRLPRRFIATLTGMRLGSPGRMAGRQHCPRHSPPPPCLRFLRAWDVNSIPICRRYRGV